MAAWQAGIVVVASAGNRGPEPMTIGVPGNVPYVITVGAMTDNYTPFDLSDDVLASFSSAGPTVEAFLKPEVVAPGGHVLGIMDPKSQISLEQPDFHDGGYYFNMSGTSQATAFVSGIAAHVIQLEPECPQVGQFRGALVLQVARQAIRGHAPDAGQRMADGLQDQLQAPE